MLLSRATEDGFCCFLEQQKRIYGDIISQRTLYTFTRKMQEATRQENYVKTANIIHTPRSSRFEENNEWMSGIRCSTSR